MIFELTVLGILIILIVLCIIFQYECMRREMYWNDKGLFIDTWEYTWKYLPPWECLYEEIPK